MVFDFTISGFKELQPQVTNLLDVDLNSIKNNIWEDNKFFTIDWKSADQNTIKTTLLTYINNNLNEFAQNSLINGMQLKATAIQMSFGSNDIVNFNVTYENVVKTPGEYVSVNPDGSLTGLTITKLYNIKLKATPNIVLPDDVKNEISNDVQANKDDPNKIIDEVSKDIENALGEMITGPNADKLPDEVIHQIEEILKNPNKDTIKDLIDIAPDGTVTIGGEIPVPGTDGIVVDKEIVSTGKFKQQIVGVLTWLPWLLFGILMVSIVGVIVHRTKLERDLAEVERNEEASKQQNEQPK